MDIDGSSIGPRNEAEIDQNLLLQFSCMNTSDRDELVSQMQRLLGPNMSYNTASFFLDMSNWNLQAAIGSYLDYALPPKLPSMSLVQTENLEAAVGPGTCFEQSWTVTNTGSDWWPNNCRLVQAGGEPFGAAPMNVPALAPGHNTILTLTLVAPSNSGLHRGFFHLVTEKGDQIGDALWADIIVESEITMALVQQLAALPVPSSRGDDSMQSSLPQVPSQDDQMC